TNEALEKLRQQFDYGPYPRISIENSPKDSANELYYHNLVTPYYLANRRVTTTEGKVILDAGCGSGYKSLILAEANPGAKIVGVDISAASVELAKKRLEFHGHTNFEFHCLSIFDIEQLGYKFDYINCDEVLYFFDDTAAVLTLFRKVLQPDGIIRSNLHNALQRATYFRAQKLFKLMGLMENNPEAEEIQLTVDILKSLHDNIDLKSRVSGGSLNPEDEEPILMNILLQEDKGYEIPDLFRALEKSDLEFLSMVNWRQWEVTDLFKDPDNLPAYVGLGLSMCSAEERLRMYELLHPIHRLIDFWCTLPRETTPETIDGWTEADWLKATIHLHPQLCTEAFREKVIEAVTKKTSVMISDVIKLPALRPVGTESFEAALLLALIGKPLAFPDLVQLWLKLHPTDWISGEQNTEVEAIESLISLFSKLEAFLYVLVEGN
ncbi:MAG: methyltransferase domain-containing protein, partial [Oceanospirillales bacterium]